jgi:hypothetical protein
MSLVHVEFPELYQRHLCRHSQLGINLVHLVALFGVWFGVYGAVYWLLRIEWVPIALGSAYLAVLLLLGIPLRIWATTVVFVGLLVAAVLGLPLLPIWAYLIVIPVFYEIQSLSHKVWTIAHDMTEFNKKYTKGFVLFVILLFCEVPLLLNYLVFDRKRWV